MLELTRADAGPFAQHFPFDLRYGVMVGAQQLGPGGEPEPHRFKKTVKVWDSPHGGADLSTFPHLT